MTKLEGLGCDGALLAGSPAHPKHAAKSALESTSRLRWRGKPQCQVLFPLTPPSAITIWLLFGGIDINKT